MRNSEIIGSEVSEEDKRGSRRALEDWRLEAMIPIEGEIEKSNEQLESILKIDDWLHEEQTRLKLELEEEKNRSSQYKTVSPSQFHFLPAGIFKKRASNPERGVAFVSGDDNNAYFNLDKIKNNDAKILETCLHEALHLASFEKFKLKSIDEETTKLSNYRGGYRLSDKFNGLNEAVVVQLTIDILQAHSKDFGAYTEKAAEYAKDVYVDFRLILLLIIKGIAEKENVSPSEILDKFKRGFFDGNMMFLRDVEKTFGANSLRVLAALGHIEQDDNTDIDEKFEEFFSSKDETRREELANHILNLYEDQNGN